LTAVRSTVTSSSFICENKYNDSKLVRVQDQQRSKSTYGDPKKPTKNLSMSRSTPDPWLSCDHFVGKASAMGQPTRPTQPSIPSGSVNE